MEGPSETSTLPVAASTSTGTPESAAPAARFDPRDLIPEPIFCISGEGWVLWMNAAAEELTGMSCKDLVGHSFASVFPETERRRMVRPFLRNRRQKSRDFYCEIPIPSARGGSRWIGMRVRLVTNSQGQSAYVCAGHDLHDLHSKLEASQIRLKELSARLEGVTASAQMRGDYLTSLSYELRAPMNGLVGMSRLLLDTELDPEQRTISEILQNSSQSLLQLVDDMLDFAKMESGQLEIEHHDFDLRVAMDTVASFLAPAFNEVQLSFTCRIHHRVLSRIKGDAGRLRQIIRCLGVALLKHTEKGEIRMSVDLDTETAHQVALRFLFTRGQDGGSVAIPTSFRAFADTQDAFLVGDQGSSLALGMARRLVHLMGGTCGVEHHGEEDMGLWVQIPFTKQEELPEPAPASLSGATLDGARVLIADPVRADRETAVRVFSEAGCTCEEAETGAEALALVRAAASQGNPFKLCFLDRDLPETDAAALAGELRDKGEMSGTRLVMTTGLGRRGDAASAESAGFAAYLVKPMADDDWTSAALEVLRRSQSGEAGESGIVTRHSVAELRRRQTRILLVEDNPLDQLVVSMVLQRLGYHPDVATGYDSALEVLTGSTYDLVLMDVILPDHSGWEITSQIRQGDGPNKNTPIIAVTGLISDSDRTRSLAMGMNDFLGKPIDLETLAKSVEHWTHGDTSDAAMPEGESATETPSDVPAAAETALKAMPAVWWSRLEELPVLDEDQLANSSMGNAEVRRMLVDAFFQRFSEPASRLRSALQEGNATRARIESHSMKGMCASLGAQRCAEIYAAIEECLESGKMDGLAALLDRGDLEMMLVEQALTPKENAA
ncbi:MAG TPA: response regulator [Candidatus Eisenbacteria bacterium]|nr:response regulator [Candidatus Eisenbacteria bacterium]